MPLPEQHAEARLAAAREASAESSWRLQHALLVSSSGFGEMVQQRLHKCRWRERLVGRGRFGRAARLGVARSRVLNVACWRLGLGVPECMWHDMCDVV